MMMTLAGGVAFCQYLYNQSIIITQCLKILKIVSRWILCVIWHSNKIFYYILSSIFVSKHECGPSMFPSLAFKSILLLYNHIKVIYMKKFYFRLKNSQDYFRWFSTTVNLFTYLVAMLVANPVSLSGVSGRQ